MAAGRPGCPFVVADSAAQGVQLCVDLPALFGGLIALGVFDSLSITKVQS